MKTRIYNWLAIGCTMLVVSACVPPLLTKTENTSTPEVFTNSTDTVNTAKIHWQEYFSDPNLISLIDVALNNNQELNIMMQEIEVAQNEVRARKGEYLPFVGVGAGAGVDKSGRYTSQGSSEATTEIMPGKETPDPLPDYMLGAYATWEVDIWKKLRNAKKSAMFRFLSTVDGKNFMITNLIAEIANSYYELLALDNQLQIVQQNIELQTNALEVVRLQKQGARVTELAVRRFEAQVLNTRSLQYGIQQRIIETENHINYLLGRYPQPIQRDYQILINSNPVSIQAGIPSQLLENRMDVKQAEHTLLAAKLDVKVAKARFYPSLGISAGIGFQAFNPSYLLTSPQSLFYSLAGELSASLVNRNAIKAAYYSANAMQIQAVYEYEQTLLNAYMEVANQLSMINNLANTFNLKTQEVEALTQSITISNNLFRSARADYMEVLLTQRDALESRFELVEIKKQQMNAAVNIYRALGGGWN